MSSSDTTIGGSETTDDGATAANDTTAQSNLPADPNSTHEAIDETVIPAILVTAADTNTSRKRKLPLEQAEPPFAGTCDPDEDTLFDEFSFFCRVEELIDCSDELPIRSIGGIQVTLLLGAAGCLHGIQALCPHAGGPLSEAQVEQIGSKAVAVCPWHGIKFCTHTGAVICDTPLCDLEDTPFCGPAAVYDTCVRNGAVHVSLRK